MSRKAKGRCPTCNRYVTITVSDDEKSYRTAASRHRPECERIYAATAEASREYLDSHDVDLWGGRRRAVGSGNEKEDTR